MLYFRDLSWLRVNGASRFDVYIGPQHRKRSDPMWTLRLRYIAAGAAWRRVREWERPSLWIELNYFQAPAHSWTDLAHFNFWELEREDDPWEVRSPRGWIEADYYPRTESNAGERLPLDDLIWRVAARHGRWFTIELAAFVDDDEILRKLEGRPLAVTSDGEEAEAEPEADFWKRHSTFYLVEDVPFGTVTVVTPRNARDPVAYAFTRAQQLIGGLPAPEHVEVADFLKRSPDRPNLNNDLFVDLHFHGYYED